MPADHSHDVPHSSQSLGVAAGVGLLPSGSPSPFGCKANRYVTVTTQLKLDSSLGKILHFLTSCIKKTFYALTSLVFDVQYYLYL